MDILPGRLSLILYAVVAVCGLALLVLWIASNRSRRNAGFASKSQLRRQLSTKTVLRATEIRPSLAQDKAEFRTSVALSKRQRSHSS
ncbi:hypothetical protein ACFCY8_13195 [Streptomyces noursei]|uniref:hypothetical protein n=1 Tax=Streptomyces noursei TaxID=1971 RepID=UPI0035E332C5